MEAESMNWFMSIWSWFTTGELGQWVSVITMVLTAATTITALTPTKVDNRVVNFLLKALNFIAGNILKNKNADAA